MRHKSHVLMAAECPRNPPFRVPAIVPTSTMSDNTTLPQLPNPLTPLAWLPSDVADQVVNGRYIIFGTLGVSFLPLEFETLIQRTMIGMDVGLANVLLRRVPYLLQVRSTIS